MSASAGKLSEGETEAMSGNAGARLLVTRVVRLASRLRFFYFEGGAHEEMQRPQSRAKVKTRDERTRSQLLEIGCGFTRLTL